ncbi:MAG: hypothetical protein JJE44_04455 [Flavobacteriaceae bacterium]|nr:hypothetical protein [Flavobacteriaceae bacterium]
MSDLLKHIEGTNKVLTNNIIDIIRDDKDWLIDLGISESELKNKESSSNLIRKKISIPANWKSIDLLLQYDETF